MFIVDSILKSAFSTNSLPNSPRFQNLPKSAKKGIVVEQSQTPVNTPRQPSAPTPTSTPRRSIAKSLGEELARKSGILI